ncbi:ThiF family adenylyltransferase [Caballeronia catudaia]|uniref:ThiF family adenylyltransferase n=1 Tax=Caballeronia catudaia TaxID=1777136 RepID=UPI000A64D616|nr:ThiF family adenylyltransferase [Caballeronia catudaia]
MLVVGCGGVGSAIAASLAAAGVAWLSLFDARAESEPGRQHLDGWTFSLRPPVS